MHIKSHRWCLRNVCAGDRLFLLKDFITCFIIKAPQLYLLIKDSLINLCTQNFLQTIFGYISEIYQTYITKCVLLSYFLNTLLCNDSVASALNNRLSSYSTAGRVIECTEMRLIELLSVTSRRSSYTDPAEIARCFCPFLIKTFQ